LHSHFLLFLFLCWIKGANLHKELLCQKIFTQPWLLFLSAMAPKELQPVHFRYGILSNLQDENGGTYTLKMTGVTHSSTELYKTQQKKDKQNKTKQHSGFCCLSFHQQAFLKMKCQSMQSNIWIVDTQQVP